MSTKSCTAIPPVRALILGASSLAVGVSAFLAAPPSNAGGSPGKVGHFLGVHSIFWDTQSDLASEDGRVKKEAISELRRSGVKLIRYGGGVNELDWRDCRGSLESRPKLKLASWMKPAPCLFGYAENESLLDALGSTSSWYVLNLTKVLNVGGNIGLSNNDQFMSYVNGITSKRRLVYFELGNELDRPPHPYTSSQLAKSYAEQATRVRLSDTRFVPVVPLVEFDSATVGRANTHNTAMIAATGKLQPHYALHAYYEGPPEGPSLKNRIAFINNLCGQIQSVAPSARLWLTEHGRWPKGNPSVPGWQRTWPSTNDQDGAMATMAFLLGLQSTSCVEGAFYHGLRAGPWNLLQVDKDRQFVRPTLISSAMSQLSAVADFRASPSDVQHSENFHFIAVPLKDDASTLRAYVVLNRNTESVAWTAPHISNDPSWTMQAFHFDQQGRVSKGGHGVVKGALQLTIPAAAMVILTPTSSTP
jgi:hypothetical protein